MELRVGAGARNDALLDPDSGPPFDLLYTLNRDEGGGGK